MQIFYLLWAEMQALRTAIRDGYNLAERDMSGGSMRLILVGGAVRDFLLGEPLKDDDYLVLGATEEEFLKRFPRAKKAGQVFSVFLVDGREFAFPRGHTLDDDLLQRDLTVNAAALDEYGELVLHPQALEDFKTRTLRPASQESFAIDPLRVFRAARFLATLKDFSAHPDLIGTMHRVAGQSLLDGLSAERVGNECMKALAGRNPSRFYALLSETGCLVPWFEELAKAQDIPAGPWPYHDDSVLHHTATVMDRLAGDPLAVWMALCHDLGKTRTDPAHWPRHHGHDVLGAESAKQLGERLRLPSQYIRAGVLAARYHMIGGQYSILRPGTAVDLLTRVEAVGVTSQFFALALADGGEDFRATTQSDLAIISKVHLKPEDENLGLVSGEKLRVLKAQALAKYRKKAKPPVG